MLDIVTSKQVAVERICFYKFIYLILVGRLTLFNIGEICIRFCGYVICINQFEIIHCARYHISNYVDGIFSLFNLCKWNECVRVR